MMVELHTGMVVFKLTGLRLRVGLRGPPLTWGRLYVFVRVIRRSALPESDCIMNICVLLQVGPGGGA